MLCMHFYHCRSQMANECMDLTIDELHTLIKYNKKLETLGQK